MGNLLEGKKEDHDIKEPQISKINIDVHSEVKNNQEKNELMISSESRCDMPSDTKENQQEKVEEQEQEQEQEEIKIKKKKLEQSENNSNQKQDNKQKDETNVNPKINN